MRAVSPVVLLALFAGCAAPNLIGDLPPTLTITDSSEAGDFIRLRVTNNAATELNVGQGSFKLLDARSTVYAVDLVTTYWSRDGFPTLVTLQQGQSAEGWLRFENKRSCQEIGPCRIQYTHPGGVITMPILKPVAAPGYQA